MDWTLTLFDVIDLRSFSNLWFWIVLAVAWSSACHWILGVPFDMILRARRQDQQAVSDLNDLVRINVNRFLHLVRGSGHWLTAAMTFVLTAMAVLGFWYQVEFAQAIVMIAFPMAVVGFLSLRTARRIEAEALQGEALLRVLARQRLWTQMIGMVSVFVTATYGMYQNFVVLYGM